MLAWGISFALWLACARVTAQEGGIELGDSGMQVGGYLETYYQWNFNDPDNGLTNARGFDNRHDSFTLSNAVVDLTWDTHDLFGRLALQIGHTPSTYYLSEPLSRGTPLADTSSAELWKYLQEARLGYRLRWQGEWLIAAGLFLSPIGPEQIAVKNNWNWSRSNLFFGLPYYHTGAQASYHWDSPFTVTIAAYNGWNSVVDNNPQKSLSAQLGYSEGPVSASVLYFGGVERPRGAPEGEPWRHLFDAYASWKALERLSLMAHANAGFEPNRFGSSRWVAAALYARVTLFETLFFAARGDVFREHEPQGASPIAWPVSWVSSATGTLEARPVEPVSIRLEYRHDQAASALYFGGHVSEISADGPFVANRRKQDTLTLGITGFL